MALSHSLPLRKEPFARRECRGFFGGILPEAGQRETIAHNLGISPRNDFAMLEQIGGECAGAVTFMPAGVALPEEDQRHHSLTSAELAEILKRLPRRPLLAGFVAKYFHFQAAFLFLAVLGVVAGLFFGFFMPETGSVRARR